MYTPELAQARFSVQHRVVLIADWFSSDSTLAQASVLGREQFPVPLGDDLDGTVDHFEGGLVVDRVRRA